MSVSVLTVNYRLLTLARISSQICLAPSPVNDEYGTTRLVSSICSARSRDRRRSLDDSLSTLVETTRYGIPECCSQDFICRSNGEGSCRASTTKIDSISCSRSARYFSINLPQARLFSFD